MFSCSVSAELLKRLDDSSEEVRSVALQALGLWLSSLTEEYNPEWCRAHLQLLFQQLLLHLDDPDSSVQEQVLGETRVGSDNLFLWVSLAMVGNGRSLWVSF